MSRQLAPGVTELSHPADVGIEVRANTYEELFDRAAKGMTLLMEGQGGVEDRAPPRERDERGAPESADSPEDGMLAQREIELDGRDRSDLLVRWLQELLYLREVHGFSYRGADFTAIGPDRLVAAAQGAILERPADQELKAVTYHRVEVAKGDQGLVARVVFDV